ncbi:MAG: ABC transporter permease [Candidatus Omnitrophota bacterium]
MADETQVQEIVIRPQVGLPHLNFQEYYKFRHLMWKMIKKTIHTQFDDKYLGFIWAFARPLLMLVVFFELKRITRANMYNTISYSLYFYSGIILWFYFREAVAATQKSISRDAGLIKKIYFPRLITPMVPVIAGVYNLFLSMIPLAIMIVWQGVYPGWRIVLLPVILIQAMALSLGVGTMFAALALVRSDYENFLKLIIYVGMFVSPVIYSPDALASRGAKIFYFLNPAAGMLLAFRSCMFHDFVFPVWQFAYSCLATVFFLIVGTTMFRRSEMYFADKL